MIPSYRRKTIEPTSGRKISNMRCGNVSMNDINSNHLGLPSIIEERPEMLSESKDQGALSVEAASNVFKY